MFQYDANTGRTITELDPAFRGQGLGQRLILKGIYTAAMLGMDYVEDESRTAMFDRAMDSLADAGYIVNDEEYWYVTDTGEQFLKQGGATEYHRSGITEVNAVGELTVDDGLIRRFTDRGWEIDGQGRDQIVLSKPGSNTVMKIVGQGSDVRQDVVRRYVNFFREHQRNPHFPRVGVDKTLRWNGRPYYVYTQERLYSLPGDEAVLDYLEQAMAKIGRGEYPDYDQVPAGLTAQQVDGLVQAVDQLYGSGQADQYEFDLGNVANIMQRANGQLVIVDPLSDFMSESIEENFADGKVSGKSRPGRVKRAGASCEGSVTDLRAKAKKYSGEKAKMYHWCANMKGGKK